MSGSKSGYNPREIETKWQKFWEKENLNLTGRINAGSRKMYVLDMFPYPSGAGLHVGHMEGYVGTDVVSRYLRMTGNMVLHPMGWDAFGLPAENYAIKTGVPPEKSSRENIDNFRNQLKLLGLSYDWEREIDTSNPLYYRFTQWLFILLFKNGLAYKTKAPVNWCPKDETVLANEQVVDGKCERCGTPVIQKDLDQWFFKITAYADRLIDGLDRIDWPESTKIMQKNWIGKKEGVKIKFKVSGSQDTIEVFTTRPDTIFGATFIALSTSHPLAMKLAGNSPEITAYIEAARAADAANVKGEKEKTGVYSGIEAENPLSGAKIPVWIADYVLAETGTGAIMGVPAHDERDYQFATKYHLPVVRVVASEHNGLPYEGSGPLVESGVYNGLENGNAAVKIIDDLAVKNAGERACTYHLRDWLVSRQRYWGAPIPMINCEKCGWQPVPEKDLPVLLPTDVDFRPSGESPIARSKTFQEGVKCPNCGRAGRREVDSMDGYVCSSWYYLRFADPKNTNSMASAESLSQFLPVDIYVGGGHTVQHLLFARFIYKVLYDHGVIPENTPAEVKDEPFLSLHVPGWILGPDSQKMSKSKGNVITPDDVVAKFGADTLRTYEMFMAPFEIDKPWNTDSVAGVYRFLTRIYDLSESVYQSKDKFAGKETERAVNFLSKKAGEDISGFRFNTAVAAMMEFINIFSRDIATPKETGTGNLRFEDVWKRFILVLAPFAPHLSEEVWHKLNGLSGDEGSVLLAKWPETDESVLKSDTATVIIQVNGRVREKLVIPAAKIDDRDWVEKEAGELAKIKELTAGKSLVKAVYIPGKILNLVVN